MREFYLLLLLPMLIQHISVGSRDVDYNKKNKTALLFFFLMLTTLVMLRHESVGNDTRNYMFFYKNFSNTKWEALGKESVEIGFLYFNKLISIFSDEPHFFLAISAVIVSVMVYPTYKRLCVDASLTIILYCIMSTFVMMFSGVRQMLAIAIGFVAYEFVRNKKKFLFVISVILAISFHTSAVMLVLMYPLYHAKIKKKWLYAVVPALAIVSIFNKPIFNFLTALLSRYTRFEGEITSTGAYTMLILFAIFAVFAFVIPDESSLDEETIGLRNFLLLSIVVQMFAPLHTLAMRLNYYYIIFIPLLLPKIIQCRSERWKEVAIVGRHIMVAFFLVYFFFNAYTSDSNLHVFPYHFFWENVG